MNIAIDARTVRDSSGAVGRHYDGTFAEVCRLLGGQRCQYHMGLFNGAEHLEAAQTALTEEVARQLRFGPGTELLDIGCGVGGPACQLARDHGWSITGITVSVHQAEQARYTVPVLGTGLGRVRVRHADAHFMPFADNAFDGAYAIESLLHCADKERVLAECRRVLQPGGRLVIWDLIARADLRADAYPLAHLFRLHDYRVVCERNGFEIIMAQDRGEEIIPLSLSAFVRLLDSQKHMDTLRCCHDFARAFEAGRLGYALFQLERRS